MQDALPFKVNAYVRGHSAVKSFNITSQIYKPRPV